MYQKKYLLITIAIALASIAAMTAHIVSAEGQECHICCEKFDEEFRIKVQPQCGHYICQLCLAQIISLNKSSTPCPTCRQIINNNCTVLIPKRSDLPREEAFSELAYSLLLPICFYWLSV